MRRRRTPLLALLVIASMLARVSSAAGASNIRLEGFVFDPNGSPVQGASIRLWGLRLEREAITDSHGFYSLEAQTDEAVCKLYAFFNDPETPGVELMPAARSIATSVDVSEQVNFTLPSAATLTIRGQLRRIESTSVITSYASEVIDPSTGTRTRIGDYELTYGTGPDTQSKFIGLDPNVVVVPTGTPVKIEVSYSYTYEKTRRGLIGWSISLQSILEAFGRFEISEGDGFMLGAGEVFDLDIREYSLAHDLVKLERLRDEIEDNLTLMEGEGFYTASERHELGRADELIQTGTYHLEEGEYDSSYVDLRQAYLKLADVRGRQEAVAVEASFSVNVLIVFIALTSVALASLLTGGGLSKLLAATGLYVPMILFLHRIYPGSGTVALDAFVRMSFVGLTFALFIEGAVPRVLGRGAGGGALPRLASVPVIFAMAKRNLRNRRLRTAFMFSTLLVLMMSFVALTSLSAGYGLTYRYITSFQPGAEGILIRPPEYAPRTTFEEGWFYPVIPSVVNWASGVDGVARIATKAENTPTLGPYGRVRGRPIYGVLGVQQEAEPMISDIDEAVVAGDPLREADTCLLEESFRFNVELGGHIVIRGVEMRVVGFFSRGISGVMDMDGEPILPKYQINYEPGSDIPLIDAVTCDPETVLITTMETALRIRDVKMSRIAVELEEGVDPEIIGKGMALTREYRFWVSSGGRVSVAHMGDLLGGKGFPLVVPWVIVVLNVVTTMMNAMYERRREINILSSIGLNPAHISGVFLAEASIIGVISGGLGYLLGLGLYPLMAELTFAPVVQQKMSAFWCVAAIGISLASVAVGSALALHGSVVLTPSLRRRWSMGASSMDEGFVDISMPVKVEAGLVDSFLGFMKGSMEGYRDTLSERFISDLREEAKREGQTWDLIFTYGEGQPSMGGIRTNNVLRLAEEGDGIYTLVLRSRGSRESAYRTGSFIRQLLMRWATERGRVGESEA